MSQLPIPSLLPHGLFCVEPPFCYGPWPGPAIDLPLLRLDLERRSLPLRPCVLLSDIPDAFDSLERALELPQLAGALALGCGSLDLWMAPPLETAIQNGGVLPIHRSGETRVAWVRLEKPEDAEAVWTVLRALAAGMDFFSQEGPQSGR